MRPLPSHFITQLEGKGTRFRTKMQVGPQPLGRNKPYAQVMVPPTQRFRSEDGERYYRHSKGARISKASHFDFDYELGHKIKFICVAKGSPRPTITWFKDGMEVYQHGYMHVSALPAVRQTSHLYPCGHFKSSRFG